MKTSETTKEEVIKDIIKSVKDGTPNHNGFLIRADVTKEIEQHIMHVCLCQGCKNHFRGLIYSSENCEKSLHQIDYAIFSFVAKIAQDTHRMETGKGHKFADVIKEATEMSMKAEQEGKMNEAVNIIIMSRDGIEFRSHNIIQSTDKSGNIDAIVISEQPFIQKIKPDSDNEAAVLMLGPIPVENLFTFYEEEVEAIKREALSCDKLFRDDELYFNEPTDFLNQVREGKIDRILKSIQPKNAKEAGRISGWNIAGEQNK